MKDGTIKLYRDEEIIGQKTYRGAPERKRIIDQWEKVYGKIFQKFAIHICPDFNEEFYNDAGKFIGRPQHRFQHL